MILCEKIEIERNLTMKKQTMICPRCGKVKFAYTEEDIKRINSLPRKTILVIENTNGEFLSDKEREILDEITLIEKRNEAERKRIEEMLAKQQADNSDDSEQ